MDTYKNLKKGDRVHYIDDPPNGEKTSGEGIICGFGEFGIKIVWVQTEEAYLAIPYQNITKL